MASKTLTPKESRLSIRASDAEKAILAQAARARRMNTSQFVLQSSLDAAQAILVDQTAASDHSRAEAAVLRARTVE
jgi:uncharacterized protein (DUF1778 family)